MKRKSITLTIAFDDDSDAVIHLPEARVLGGEQSSTLPFVLPPAGPARHELELSPELKLLSSDRQLAQRLGYESADLLGRSFIELLHEDCRMSLLALIGQAATGASTGSQSVRLLDRQGVELPASLELEGRFEAQRFSGLRAVLELEREAAPVSAASHLVSRELEERLKTMLDKAPIAIAQIDERGRFETANAALCQLLGYRPEELAGQPFTFVFDPSDAGRWNDDHAHRRLLRKDGKTVHALIDAVPIGGTNGSSRKLAYFQDVSERIEMDGEMQNRLAEMKAQEEELRQNAEELEATQESMRRLTVELEGQVGALNNAAIVSEADLRGSIIYVNDEFCRISKYGRDELIDQNHRLLKSGHQADALFVDLWATISAGKVWRGVIKNRAKDGSYYWVSTTITPVVDRDRKPIKYVGVRFDITEQVEQTEQVKAQEEELRQNAEELEAAQEELRRANLELAGQLTAIDRSTAVVEFDVNGNIVKVNDNFLRIFGYGRDEVVGKNHRMFATAEDGESKEYQDFWARLRSGRFESGTFRRVGKDGRPVWLQGSYNPILGVDGKPYKVIKFAADVTAQRQLAAEVEASRRELESIFATAPVGISITNERGEYTFVNDTFCLIHGYNGADTLLGKPFTTTIPLPLVESAKEAHRRTLSTHESGAAQTQGLTQDGKTLSLIANWTCMQNRDGETQVVTFINDVTQSKAEEERLRDLSLVASKTDNAVIIANAQGLIEWVNEGFQRITGYSYEEVRGRKPGSFLQGPETDPAAVQRIREAIAARRAIVTEILNYSKDGRPYWLYLSITPVLGENGELQKFIAIERDITEEKVLGDQLEQLSLVASKTSNAVIITDKFGSIQWVNDGFTTISGYSLDEVIGRKPGSFLQGPDTDPETVQLIRQKLKGKESFTVEILNYSKDGRPYWLSLNITPILDDFGATQRFIAIEADITERKAAESRLEELSLVASETDNAVIITDRFGKITWANEGFSAISGYTLDEALGRTPGELLQGPDTDPETVRRIGQKLRAKQRVQEEILNYHKNGTAYWLSLNITPILDGHGDVVKFIALETDVTERKAAEERLRVFNEQLQSTLNELQSAQNQLLVSEKMAALGQLIAGIAHEVNTPISAVKSSARNVATSLPELIGRLPELLNQLPEAEQAALREFIQRALTADVTLTTKEERQARRAMTALFEQAALERPDELADKLVEIRIIDQIEPLLPLFKGQYRDRILETAYQLGQVKVNMNNIQIASEKTAKIITALKNYSHMQTSDQMAEISLIDNLDTVLTLYSNQFKHGIQLERDFEPVPNLPAFADELGQVWTNVIQNGIQAMKGSGTLKVSLKQEGQNAVVSITDSGPGIPEHIRHRIFEPFFTTKPQGEGTGLGLDIVRKIVEKHAGRIEVDSEPGRTTFTVTLPLSPAAVSQGAAY